MSSKVKPIPEDRQSVTPYLAIKNAGAAIEFYKQVFGATEKMRMAEPDGKIGHAEIEIGKARIMISDEYPEIDVLGPQSRGGSTVGLHILVEDVDTVFSRAVAAGAKQLKPVSDQFYGERSGQLADPFGHVWYIGTVKEDLSDEEIQSRYEALMKR
ncbi:MAG TPA: VOC family protein [Blastocatellia bacterium]|jgi:PhnB protein|nr:VOC family protein [Blastocatellia bacterium]